MRIVSKFKDYYDSMQMYADYEATPYYRNIFRDELNVDFLVKASYSNIAIGLCGKIYKAIHKYCRERECDVTYYSLEDANIHKSFHSTYKQYFGVIECHDLFRKYSAPIFIIKEGGISYRSKYSHTIIAHTTNKSNHSSGYGMKEETLEKYEFDKVLSKEIAYTELQSYMHFLTQEYKQEPVISDRDRASLHGFDNNSFKRI
jgi:hypothetical protein